MMDSLMDQWKYDVFISFRGADTRNGFISHLHAALDKKGIEAFVDDEINRGEEINRALLQAIEESMVAVVIFSQNYASSRWCLDELKHIMHCKRKRGQIVLPVFYGVDPSHVRKQTGRFGIVFSGLMDQFKHKMPTVKKWKAAMTEAANLAGWDSSVVRPESALIDVIVKDIVKKLNHLSSSDTEGLVGIESSMEQIEELLCIGSADVRFIGIWGMGGIGKTTLATTTFNRISCQFESCCFLADVRGESKKMGLSRLQKELFSTLLDDCNLDMQMRSMGFSSVRTRLRRKKVLIVLDDVNNSEQLQTLAGGLDWFGPGSRIIVTTRERSVLVSHGVHFIYEVKDLNEGHALELFNRFAFKQRLQAEEYNELPMQAIDYCKGLPLALKVLGSHLCGRSIGEWSSLLSRLEKHSNTDIQQVLRISFDGLDDLNKSLFLDIACYFRGHDKDYVSNLLSGFGFHPDSGIKELFNNSLITVLDNTLGMHDLLQDMGKEIVRQESLREPGKRSRLWDYDDVVHVLTQKTGTNHVECMVIDLSKLSATDEMHFSSKAFMKMKNLRLLDVHGAYGDRKVHLSGSFNFLYYKLQCLRWEGYPLKHLPSDFNPRKLINLIMPRSCIKQLWTGILHLNKLQFIDVSHSSDLTETPDFTGVPNLESLILEGCTSLHKVHPSIGFLRKLILLNLKNCNSLRSLPDSIALESLEVLDLSGCLRLGNFPNILGNMEHLSKLALDETAIDELPMSFKHLTGLVFLSLRNCKNFRHLPNEIYCLESLKIIDLFGCSKLDNLPESIGFLKCLEELDIGETAVRQPPSSIALLENLKVLSFRGAKPLERSWLYKLFRSDSLGLVLPCLKGLRSLTDLDLSDCNLTEGMIPGDFYCLPSLRTLNISRNDFLNIPASISLLPQLQYLNLDNCKNLRALSELPATIHEVSADNCALLEIPSNPKPVIGNWTWPIFYFTNCFKLTEKEGRNSTSFEFLRSHIQSQTLCPLQGPSNHWRRFDVVVPGTAIPDWFSQQNLGSSVIMHLPQSWCSGLKGLAVSAVFGTTDDPSFLSANPSTDIAISCSLEAIDQPGTRRFNFLISGIPLVQSDHLWMDFYSQTGIGKLNWVNNCRCIKASFGSCVPGIEVRKCGIHLVYEQDENISNLSTVHPTFPCENNLVHEFPSDGMVVEEGNKLKRDHDDSNEDGHSGTNSSLSEGLYPKRLKRFNA